MVQSNFDQYIGKLATSNDVSVLGPNARIHVLGGIPYRKCLDWTPYEPPRLASTILNSRNYTMKSHLNHVVDLQAIT